jgi:hypothetical protein
MNSESIEDRINKPVEWDMVKKLIITHARTGIPEINLPAAFILGESVRKALDAMQVERSHEEELTILTQIDAMQPEERRKAKEAFMREEFRCLLVQDGKLVFHTHNQGVSRLTPHGARVVADYLPNTCGSIHNHPIDEYPSSADIRGMLLDHVVEIIVTPRRYIVLLLNHSNNQFRSTGVFDRSHKKSMIDVYLKAAYTEKRKRELIEYEQTFGHMFEELEQLIPEEPGFMPLIQQLKNDVYGEYESGLSWIVEPTDLRNMGIALYEGLRGQNVCTRVN